MRVDVFLFVAWLPPKRFDIQSLGTGTVFSFFVFVFSASSEHS